MTFTVTVAASVRRYIRRLAHRIQEQVVARIEMLAADPYDRGVSKPLQGPLAGKRSSDLNNLRIIYEVDDTIRVLDVIDIGPRGDIYKR